jgi:IS1 family transposase
VSSPPISAEQEPANTRPMFAPLLLLERRPLRGASFRLQHSIILTMPNRSSIMVSMNRLSTERRAQVIRCLVEGNSIRSTVRMTGVAKNTVTKLLVDLGSACAAYQDAQLRNLTCRRVEADEIWSFVYAKAKNVPEDKRDQFGYGDVWTWTAIDPDSKLMVSWLVGERNITDGIAFMRDVASRLTHRVQLTTDAHKAYLWAVDDAFGGEIDYAQLLKEYGVADTGDASPTARRYSPNVVTATDTRVITGNPDPDYVSTSYVERSNLTMRMGMRRFTRLTNAFSKKVENLAAAVSLHFMYYNFARPHTSLRNPYPRTPAMAAGVADHVWTCGDRGAAGLGSPREVGTGSCAPDGA